MCSPDEEEHPTEADYKAAKKLTEGYIDEHHESIYWYLRSRCHAKKEHAEDAMQNLWLYVFRQLLFNRADQMYRSFLYNMARWRLIDIQTTLNREDPLDLSFIDLRNKKELDKHESAALKTMYEQSLNKKNSEPANDEEEAALFTKFWSEHPEVDLTDQQKVITFEKYRDGLSLKEISEKHGVPIATLSDWMLKVEIELRRERYKEENES